MVSKLSEENKSTTPKPFIFVLIPFDERFRDIYKFGIKGAAEEIEAYAERVDEQIFTEGILERIFNQISKADVIIADMTGRNPNVFYEVGYAHALGKIVLLLTQNTDDIPFDLKHRQHIVYGGKIETLRKELINRLIWAINKSKEQKRQNGSERFSISIFGTEIPKASLSNKIPVLKVETSPQKDLVLPINVRNASLEITPNITHIYLFTSPDSNLIPGELDRIKWSWVPLNVLDATIDSFNSLSKQFRLNATIPSLPPGAIDQFSINLMFSGKHIKSNEFFRLRIHSSAGFCDFPFKIKIKKENKSK